MIPKQTLRLALRVAGLIGAALVGVLLLVEVLPPHQEDLHRYHPHLEVRHHCHLVMILRRLRNCHLSFNGEYLLQNDLRDVRDKDWQSFSFLIGKRPRVNTLLQEQMFKIVSFRTDLVINSKCLS